MYCWKCGSELNPGQQYCGNCGAAQERAPQDQIPIQERPPVQEQPPVQGQTPPQWQKPPVPPTGGAGGDQNQTILTVFAVVCAAVYGLRSIWSLFGLLGNLFRILHYSPLYAFFSTVFGGLCVVLGIWMCLTLLLMGLKRTPQNTCGLLLCMCGGGAALIIVRVVWGLFSIILPHARGSFAGSLWTTLGVIISVGGVYAILRFLIGEDPITGKSTDELKEELQYTLSTLGQTVSEAGSQAAQKARDAQQARNAQAAQNSQTAWNGAAAPQPGPYNQPPQGYAPFRLKTDRSLLMCIILNIVTCGIYSCFFLYSLAQDVNVACEGDGKSTAGLLKFILLSFVTCGIYAWYWYYSLGNRLAENAPRYGMNFQENGTTVLLWMLLGGLLCGIGYFIAFHIIIKNTNMICDAYNRAHNM